MAHDVFISHSTQDKPTADAVCATLERNGVRCWIAPRDITPGADWGESIVNAIRTSRVLLLLFSTNANKSRQIKREVEIAADGNVTIVPVRIENILPTDSFKYFLGNIHWLDALTPPLEKHLEEAAAKVKGILSTESGSSSVASQPSFQAKAPIVRPPPRRNVLPITGGIITVLMATLAILFLWPWKGPLVVRSSVPPALVKPQAVPANAVYKIVSKSSGKVLGVPRSDGRDEVPIRQYTYNGGTNQQWRIVPVGSDVFKIVSVASGKVLDVPRSDGRDEAPIQQYTYNGGANQQWRIVSVGSHVFKIVSVASGKVLDVPRSDGRDEVPIQQYTYNGGANQWWQLVPIASP